MPILHAVFLDHGPSWDSSPPIEGQELWPEHAELMDAMVEEGLIVLGGPLGEGDHVLLIIDAENEHTIRSRLAADPWHERKLLTIHRIEPWHIRLDGR